MVPAALAGVLGVAVGGLGLGAVHLVSASTPTTPGAIFVPLDPVRILDTRIGLGTAGGSTAPLGPGGALDLQVTGAGGVPDGAAAVVMNVTSDQATAPSYLTIWPAGTTRPVVSNLNFAPGAPVPNLVTVKLGSGGKVSIFNFAGTTHVLADVAGYYKGPIVLSDLSNAFPAQTQTVSSPITIPGGQCQAALTANFGAAAIGKVVVGTLTDANGGAVLPNAAAVVPSVVIATTQGGAVPNITVCAIGASPLTIPAGSVFHYRLIDG
jgi:hypothetical protein